MPANLLSSSILLKDSFALFLAKTTKKDKIWANIALSDKSMDRSYKAADFKVWFGDPWWSTKSFQGSRALHYNTNMVFIFFTLIPSQAQSSPEASWYMIVQ